MKDYNGYSGAQRDKAQRWLNAQWAAGAFPRPSRCCACGQTHGIIDAHAEDYSEPFAHGKTDEYPLCFVCHMMVHCRFRHPAAWAAYRRHIGNGYLFQPFYTRNFPLFQKLYLGDTFPLESMLKGMIPGRRPLDGIAGKDHRALR